MPVFTFRWAEIKGGLLKFWQTKESLDFSSMFYGANDEDTYEHLSNQFTYWGFQGIMERSSTFRFFKGCGEV